ncbi:26S proteasome non-ATPase regulatory protein [Phytophthora megakarya]|uniref:26S proteasome non-ATPase regulatory protein n=1 Tax=Phytophthora megakarya TaxID=4795 RepID=A0A225V469_9STRA|nr:26S proteasome non-ATPase regulatory protein [Phytophthora megakarya]
MSDVMVEYEAAVTQKEALEAEIEAIVGELTSGKNPGLLRHSLALKQTDHQTVMKTIESLLPRVFAARSGQTQAQETSVATATDQMQQLETQWKTTLHEVKPEERDLLPFAVVESVQRDSPASSAGLQSQDQVLRFGTADASNHRQLAAVKDIVQRNINNSIRVLIRRDTEVLALELTPHSWNGPGVLGCLLQPI